MIHSRYYRVGVEITSMVINTDAHLRDVDPQHFL